jgi:hypothetical protein
LSTKKDSSLDDRRKPIVSSIVIGFHEPEVVVWVFQIYSTLANDNKPRSMTSD